MTDAIMIAEHAYQLTGLRALVWDNAHARYGQPDTIAAIYLGHVVGARTWHIFEIRVAGDEVVVLLMPDADLARIVVEEIT